MAKNNLLLAGMFVTLSLINAASNGRGTNRHKPPAAMYGCGKKVRVTAPFVDKPYRGCRR